MIKLTLEGTPFVKPTHVCFYALYFAEGSPEIEILGVGNEEHCNEIKDLTLAVNYSGDRKVQDAEVMVRPIPEVIKIFEEEEDD